MPTRNIPAYSIIRRRMSTGIPGIGNRSTQSFFASFKMWIVEGIYNIGHRVYTYWFPPKRQPQLLPLLEPRESIIDPGPPIKKRKRIKSLPPDFITKKNWKSFKFVIHPHGC